MNRFWYSVGLLIGLAGCGSDSDVSLDGAGNTLYQGIVAGAGYTTFDATVQGCNDSPNGVNCNNYDSKSAVYTSGGPVAAGLSDGSYYFSVLVPGSQNGGFVDGATGNLSDLTVGGTAGDLGTGDDWTNRVFTVTDHLVTYTGTHALGTSPNGHLIVQLMPYNNTSNGGGVYILALCQVGATSSSQCKYDAFRAPPDLTCDPEVDPDCDIIIDNNSVFGYVAGTKYYDANANGQMDEGEVGIANWPIHFTDLVEDIVFTNEAGLFEASLIEDVYVFNEILAAAPWMQTGNLVDQLQIDGGASATLNVDKTYTVSLVDDSNVLGMNFGNLCVGPGAGVGGHTLGYWSNKNGQALIGSDDLAMLVALNLRSGSGANYDPTSKTSFRSWLLSATATNMAYMLSAQMAAMSLNVLNGYVSADSLVYAPGTLSANVNGFATVGALLAEANTTLGANGYTVAYTPVRLYQEAVKNALDKANNNGTFVQATPATCPAPVFP